MKRGRLKFRFRQFRRRGPWECLRCGASVTGLSRHAAWHAAVEHGTEMPPEDTAQYERPPKEIVILVEEDGMTFMGK